MFDEMFPDDVYDLNDAGGNYKMVPSIGGWRIVDIEAPERFKTVFANKNEAIDLCEALNEGQRCIDQRSERDPRD